MGISSDSYQRIGLIGFLIIGLAVSPYGNSAGDDSPRTLPRNADLLPPPSPGAGMLPGGMAPGSDPYHILMNSHEVQEDLKMTETQIRHLSRNDGGFLTKPRNTANSNPQALQAQIAEDQNKIARVLSPEQLNRFKEIMLQVGAPCSVLTQDPEEAAKIQLSPVQSSQIGGMCQNLREQMRGLAEAANRDHPNDPCAVRAAVMEQEPKLKLQLTKDVEGVLTDAQQKAYLAIQGRQLSLTRVSPPECE
jgi:hypothetical protein